MTNYKELCEKTCLIAKEAGKFIKTERISFSPGRIEIKSAENDLVSYVDKEAEVIIVHALRKLISGACFITEEKTTNNSCDAEYCWVVDPLDGTTNFAHALAPYCVSIALLENGVPVVGVVYEITADECFYAWKYSAAYLNGYEIKVSETEHLNQSLIATGFSVGGDSRHEEYHHQNDYLMRHT
ncbi:MAG: inositol monophosphatase family protein, partial [Rikenellaceae bacterium]